MHVCLHIQSKNFGDWLLSMRSALIEWLITLMACSLLLVVALAGHPQQDPASGDRATGPVRRGVTSTAISSLP